MSNEKLKFEDIEDSLKDGKVLSSGLVRKVFKTVFDVTDRLCESPVHKDDGSGTWLNIEDGKFVYYNIKGDRGEKGDQGIKGEKGAAYRFQGEYSAVDTYTCDGNFIDTVRYNGNLYVCKSNGCIGKLPTDSNYWGLMAERGAQGEPGRNAVVSETDGMIYFDVNADGDLIVHCNDSNEASHFSIENGELIYRIE